MDKHNYTEKEKQQFRQYANKVSPNSNIVKDCISAFIIGGAICIVGELLSDLFKKLDINADNIKILVPCSLILLSDILTLLGLYRKIAKYAGAGTLVPITGFANAICSVSIDSTAEGYILGVGAKMFTIAGPVILYGTFASVLYGLIYYLVSL